MSFFVGLMLNIAKINKNKYKDLIHHSVYKNGNYILNNLIPI